MTYRTLLASAAVLSFGAAMPALSQTVLTLSDGVVENSLCVGGDCGTGISFGFDTLRLKENNLRIHFEDSSSSASFPTGDWRIRINDSSNGGDSYFGVEDASAGNTPFRVQAGARNNALYVDAQGDIGIGTNSPAVDIDIKTGNTPTVRLQQDTSSGFGAQTWDMAGNEANFFIRDATNGSTLPIRVFPSAPSNALTIEGSTGDIGLGTTSPGADLHVLAGGSTFSADANTLAVFQNNAATTDVARVSIISGNAGNGQIGFGDVDNEFAGRIRYFHTNNEMDFILDGSVEVLSMLSSGPNTLTTATSTAVLTSAGVWQDASSRALKQDIASLSLNDAMDTLNGLQPVTFNYIKEPGEMTVGFIAEDVPDLVATASRKTLSSLDIVAVLTRVVQEQNARLEAQGHEIKELRQMISVQ